MRTTPLFCLVLFAGCVSPGLDDAPDVAAPVDPDRGSDTTLSNLTWKSGPFAGDFAIGFSLEPEEAANCRFFAAAQGVSVGLPPTMILMVEGGVDYESHSIDRGQGSLVFDANAHVHAVQAVDERLPESEWPWADSQGGNFTLTAGAVTNVTFGAMGVTPTGPPWAVDELNGTSAIFLASCEPAVRILKIYASNEIVLFNEASLTDGASAHAKLAFEDSGVALAGRVEREVQAEMGIILVSIRGDLLLNHVGAGVVRISYPGGSETIVDHPTQVLVEYVVLGNPLGAQPYHWLQSTSGTYSVEATYASVEHMGMLEGAIIGLDQVDHLSPLMDTN